MASETPNTATGKRFSSGSRWLELAFTHVDGAWLGAFRILFGLTMCVSMVRFLVYGWVERFFVEPKFHFKYWGFHWVEPMAPYAMELLFYALAALALCVAAGFHFRLAVWLFAIGLTYVQLIDVSTYLNHYYLASLLSFLLAVSPAGRIWSVDQLRARRRDTRVPALWLYLLRCQVGLVYAFAGLAKLNGDWLIHAQPLRIWLGAKTDLPVLGPLFTLDGVPLLMSWAGFLFDSTIVFWLSLRRTRAWAYVVVVCFHAMTRLLFPIGMFPVIMTLAALAFFEPDWPRQMLSSAFGVWNRLTRRAERSHAADPQMSLKTDSTLGIDTPSSLNPRRALGLRRAALAGAVVYCAVQVVLPLRFLAYGGNVMWHEQGMRFAWRVMLRAKGGSARFVVEEPTTGRRAYVDPDHYLTGMQEMEMVSQPDLILQLAHHIAHEYTRKGWQGVSVRVESRVSLNGRRSKPLVDPSVDLTVLRDGLAPLAWVTDPPSEPPHHTRPVL